VIAKLNLLKLEILNWILQSLRAFISSGIVRCGLCTETGFVQEL
jgi:hypothetical protein